MGDSLFSCVRLFLTLRVREKGKLRNQLGELLVDLCHSEGSRMSERFDISSEPNAGRESGRDSRRGRFLGIHFTCCRVYSRIYLNAVQTAYHGNCPKCCRPLTIRVGAGGTDKRFFEAE